MSITITSSTGKSSTAKAENASVENSEEENTSEAAEESADENTEESDTSETESEGSDEEGQKEEGQSKEQDKTPKVGKLQKRFSKLTQRATRAEQEAAYWREKALSADKKPAEEKKVEVKTSFDQPKPKESDFATHAEWVEALAEWAADKREAAREAKSKAEYEKSDRQRRVEASDKRVDEFKKTNPDFEEKLAEFLEENPEAKFSDAVTDLILDSELGPAVVAELIKDPELFEKINRLGPLAAAKEFGKLEAKLAKPPQEKKEKKLTTAPAPLEPVSGKGSSVLNKPLNDPTISFAEYERQRMQQLKKSRG